MANFNEIAQTRKLLGLSETAMLKEITSAYRRLAHHHHPDKHGSATDENDVMIKKLNWAYRLLLDYCADYKYSFREEDIGRTYPHEEHMRKWRDDWFNSI